MLTATQMERYTEVILWALKTARKGKFRKNEVILIRYDAAGIRLAELLQKRILDLGSNPLLRAGPSPMMEHNYYARASDRQLRFQAPGERELCENLNGNIYLHGPESLTHLSKIDPKRIGKSLLARKPLRDILQNREEKGLFSWTLCTVPTYELAKQAQLSLRQYTNQVIRACYLDHPNPVSAWEEIHRDASSIKNWLNSLKVVYLHIESEKTDLTIKPGKNRRWVGISGHNIPSFEIFLSPDWRGTEGVYFADQPTFRSGNYVEGVQITFRRGNVVKVEAKRGKHFAINQMAMDRGAGRVGEFSLTDKRFSRINKFMANTLYDENFGGRYGNCHLAVGASYSDTYSGDVSKLTKEMKRRLGFNDSALHWDLVNTRYKIVTAHLASGKKLVIYENGKFNY
jgi:aminopeptidase